MLVTALFVLQFAKSVTVFKKSSNQQQQQQITFNGLPCTAELNGHFKSLNVLTDVRQLELLQSGRFELRPAPLSQSEIDAILVQNSEAVAQCSHSPGRRSIWIYTPVQVWAPLMDAMEISGTRPVRGQTDENNLSQSN
jgi:hypothetical protein